MCAFVFAVAIGDGMAVFDAVFKHADIRVSFLTDAGDDEIFLGDKMMRSFSVIKPIPVNLLFPNLLNLETE